MILLDTRTFLWAVADDQRLGPEARRVIATADVRYLSSISHVELAIRSANGSVRLPQDYERLLGAFGIESLPFTDEHATKVAVDREHGGTFDWMLLAQAAAEGLILVTADRALSTYDGTLDATR
ncbi:type II toxin-antitoxin system VapC family toxin [Nocardioides marmoriginsengisoli]|uniref:type II toxin-antitoxin system VapC family toxin n=1 Tax=Nocardioides marmoriginsengisoli TaxID=661483 RepID=UPI00160FDFFA|nr:type II toxin-antitoxin system VapC family toxin [Nocardioides marmoriginsengisoli]